MLGFAATPLAAFFHALGQAMFGARWADTPHPPATEPDRVDVEGLTSRTMQVVEQMRLGLLTDEITAALDLRLRPRRPSEDDEVAFDDDEDVHRHYPIAARAWDFYWPASVTSWTTSQMRVRAEHVQVAEGRAHRPGARILGSLRTLRPDLRDPAHEVLHTPVVILRAEGALRALLPLTSLPDLAQAERFRTFQNRLLDELVAAAWRAIALHAPFGEPLQPRVVLRYLNHYLDAQSIDGDANRISDQTLEVVARKIVQQWNKRSTASCVLLNSSPLKPPRPPL